MPTLTYSWHNGLPTELEEFYCSKTPHRPRYIKCFEHCIQGTTDGSIFYLVVTWDYLEAYTSGLPEDCYPSEATNFHYSIYAEDLEEVDSGSGDTIDAEEAYENFLAYWNLIPEE